VCNGLLYSKCVSDFIFRNPGMDVQEILFLRTCFGFIPITRDVQEILFLRTCFGFIPITRDVQDIVLSLFVFDITGCLTLTLTLTPKAV
jgi:hypothetical protein